MARAEHGVRQNHPSTQSTSGSDVDLSPWANFAVAAVGIAGALTGLLFVGISLNLEFMLENGHLPARAGTALSTLLGTALLNLCILRPGHPTWALGLEALAIALTLPALAIGTCRSTLRRRKPGDPLAWALQTLATNLVTPIALGVATVTLFAAHDIRVFALATGCGLVTAVWEARVLLIEIRR